MPPIRRRLGQIAFRSMLWLTIAVICGVWSLVPAHTIAAASATQAVVTTTHDVVDGDVLSIVALNTDPGADGRISFREALLAAEATPPGDDLLISFMIPQYDSGFEVASQSWQIDLVPETNSHPALLPELKRGHVVIDATTQPGDVAQRIVINGYNVYTSQQGQDVGFTITSPANTLRGLGLVNFYDGAIVIAGTAAVGNHIEGNAIGVSLRGQETQNSGVGVEIRAGASDNVVGGATEAQRNVIVDSELAGVRITGDATHDNTVAGNWIGIAPDGSAIHNTTGITISNGAGFNQVGLPGAGNLIGGNDNGIYIDNADHNIVIANTIGFAPDGLAARANLNAGIYLTNGAHDNQIGGSSAAERNVIGHNGAQGMYVANAGTTRNIITGNFIGLAANGITTAGNLRHGIFVGYDAANNQIGGSQPGAGNVVVYNGLGGIRVDTDGNTISGNFVGVGPDGITAFGNPNHGIRIGGSNNIVGPGNTVGYSQASGLLISGDNTNVHDNRILQNTVTGLYLTGAHTRVADNEILGNGLCTADPEACMVESGIYITGTATMIANNVIHDNFTGIRVYEGQANTISANSITANRSGGIVLGEGGNAAIEPPALELVEPELIRGTACPSCTVEIFTDRANQGGMLLGTTTADAEGHFELVLTTQITNTNVTATHTDASGNTSQFASARGVRAATQLYFLDLPTVISPAAPESSRAAPLR